MYKEIASNRNKTILLFSLFLIFVIGVGYFFSYLYDNISILIYAAIFSIIMSWISYFYSDKIALKVSGAKPVTKSQAPTLYRTVENLAITAGIPKPDIYLIPEPAMNAFATGRDPEHASVAVTLGLLQALDKQELKGVIAHELSHIKNRDILLQTVVVTLVGLVALASRFFLRFSFFSGGNRREGQAGIVLFLIGIVLAILAPISVKFIQLAISRKREYLADASGALLTRYPKGLADALRKISSDKNQLRTANEATAHLFLANPFKSRKAGSWLSGLLSTHPPVEDRIEKLENMIPGEDY